MRRLLHLLPLVIAIVIAAIGHWAQRTVEHEMKEKLGQEMATILAADSAALEMWTSTQLRSATYISTDPLVKQAVLDLNDAAMANPRGRRVLLDDNAQTLLGERLRHAQETMGFMGYLAINREGRVLAGPFPGIVGRTLSGRRLSNLAKVFETGQPQLLIPKRDASGRLRLSRGPTPGAGSPRPQARQTGTTPLPSPEPTAAAEGNTGISTMPPDVRREGDPVSRPTDDIDWRKHLTVMLSCPILDSNGDVVAAIAFRIIAGEDFTRILSVARFGQTGETIAFNDDGILISRSRFEHQLKAAGLLANTAEATSVLTLELRDPGGDITQGHIPTGAVADRPLTHVVRSALAGTSGVDVNGFPDYRGVRAIGAWRWLPAYGIAIATKVDYAEAYRPVFALRRIFRLLAGLLAMCSVGMILYSLLAASMGKRVRQAELQARKLGQYRLDERIGEGGMGVVYRASHALLRRPTAIKLLVSQKRKDDPAIVQFEQEVQLTSQLTHPNTIQIYDYGRTRDGIFYYAMEYLDGLSLKELIARDGPQLPGRIIHVLGQVCGSLAEAHAAGLVHRDIKPPNIFLTRRGGKSDYVKVLDFGLIMRVNREEHSGLPRDMVAGTPRYMAPEIFRNPEIADARSDIYSLGAVGFFLLTGRDPFEDMDLTQIMDLSSAEGAGPLEHWSRHLEADDSLENLLLRCLDQDPDKRPASAEELAVALDACEAAGSWSDEDASTWWRASLARKPLAQSVSEDAPTRVAAATVRITLDDRVDGISTQ